MISIIKIFYKWNDSPDEIHEDLAVKCYVPLTDKIREEYDHIFYVYDKDAKILGNKGYFTVVDYQDS
jgi:hypothetical protein